MRRIFIVLLVVPGLHYGQGLKSEVDSILSIAPNILKEDSAGGLALLERASMISKQINYHSGIIRSNYDHAVYRNRIGDKVLASQKFMEVIKMNSELDLDSLANSRILFSNWFIAIIFSDHELSDLAVKFFESSLQIASSHGIYDYHPSLLFNLQKNHIQSGDYEKAREVLTELLDISKEGSRDHLRGLNGFGVSYHEQGNYDESIYYYLKLIDHARKYDSPANLDFGYHNIGDIHHKRKEYSNAISNFRAALDIQEKNDFNRYITLRDLGRVYLDLKDDSMAVKVLEDALIEFEKEPKDRANKIRIHQLLSEAYTLSNNPGMTALHDSIAVAETYSYEHDQTRLEFLNRQNELRDIVNEYYAELEAEQEAVRTRNLLLSLTIAFATLFFIVTAYHIITRNRARKVLKESLEKIDWDTD